jgi:CubicO group peptidase (beta-lactamase class C family)
MTFLTRRRVLATAASALPFIRLSAEEKTTSPWQAKLEAIRVKHELPGLGGAIVTSAGLRSSAVCGVRKAGTDIAVMPDDLWHLGSNTKAMTSTLAAIAVEAGKLKWESTLGEVFPKQKDLKKSPLAKATLTQLLSHWSGLPANAMWGLIKFAGGDLRHQRETALQLAARTPDLPEPGKEHLYSNWGYALAGHMLEQVWDAPWETLMKQRVFEPLGITHAGFGGAGTPGKIDQPWPHNRDGKPTDKNGPDMDNAAVLGPAGTVHMPLSDWAKFIAEHLAGRAGKGKLLKTTASYEHLHTATQSVEPYAFGWLAVERPWGGHVLNHNGSNTMNHSVAWLAPEKDFAVIACTNSGSDRAAKALDDVAGLLIQEHTAK